MLNNTITGKVPECPDSEYIDIDPMLCSSVRYARSKCRECIEGCPRDAIELTAKHGIKIDASRCSGCGICLSVCPNGVFEDKKNNDLKIISRMREMLKISSGKTIRFKCDYDNGEGSSISIPCLSRITENLLIAAFVNGAERVQIKKVDCNECEFKRDFPYINNTLRLTGQLCNLIGRSGDSIEEVEDFEENIDSCQGPIPSEESLSRRGLFKIFRRQAVKTTASIIPDVSEKKKEKKVFKWEHKKSPKRLYLLELLSNFDELHPALVTSSAIKPPFGKININDKCIGCNVCETICPVNAIKRVKDNGYLTISFDSRLCVNCQNCRDACIIKAIEIDNDTAINLKNILCDNETELVRTKYKICSTCGDIFISGQGDICPICSKISDRAGGYIK